MEALFWKRSDEFEMFTGRWQSSRRLRPTPLSTNYRHKEYDRLHRTAFEKGGDFSSAYRDRDRLIRASKKNSLNSYEESFGMPERARMKRA